MNNLHHDTQLAYYDHHGVEDYEKQRGVFTRGINRTSGRKAKIIAAELASYPVGSILEVGAGSGLVSYSVIRMLPFKRYVLMDLSEQMLATAQSRIDCKHVEFTCGDIAATSFSANEFDAIIGTDIIHHLDDPVRAMTEWRRVSKNGAKLVILETNAHNPMILRNIGVEHEVRVFLNTRANLSKWLNEAGWRNVKVVPAAAFTPSCPPWLTPIFNAVDKISVRIPFINRIAVLWLLTAEN